jgi:uncharacterized small protein (DUF1192 family)
MLFRSRKRGGQATGGAAVAEPAESLGDLLAEIDRLSATRSTKPDPELDRHLLSVRHRAGLAMLARHAEPAAHPEPDLDRLGNGAAIPEVRPDELSPELLRGAILSRGCLLIRGLVDPDEARGFRDEIERAFGAREEAKAGESAADGYFDEFGPEPSYDLGPHRIMVSDPNGMWVADSPRVAGDLFGLLGRAGFLELATGYLGDRPAISVNKSTLRRVKADPNANYDLSHWHQDGAFMGKVRALNIWLSLSRCGDVAPGLDLVPRRIDHIVPTGTEGAVFPWSVSHEVAKQSAGDAGITRPLFSPGDALLFDELFLHATGASPHMTETRYAVECWFFDPSAFPAEYPPLAS